MTGSNKANEDEQKLGLKAFYSAMKTIGYETVTHNGKPSLYIQMAERDLMSELSLVLDNVFITMLSLAIEDVPEKDNLHVSRKFVEAIHEQLHYVAMGLMEQILDDEGEAEAHDR